MELITQDLETAVFRNNGMQWLRAENEELSAAGGTTNTVALQLFSPALIVRKVRGIFAQLVTIFVLRIPLLEKSRGMTAYLFSTARLSMRRQPSMI